MTETPKIWCLEDDPGVCDVISEVLSPRFDVESIPSLAKFQEYKSTHPAPDVLLADLRLGDGNFLDIIGDPTQRPYLDALKLIVISHVDDLDKLRFCLDLSVDDYITKPFNCNELLAKLERMLHSPSFAHGLDIDLVKRVVRRNGETSEVLTGKELQVLNLLLAKNGELVSREILMNEVWPNTRVVDKTLDVHLSNLRKKLSNVGLEIRSTKKGVTCSAHDMTAPARNA